MAFNLKLLPLLLFGIKVWDHLCHKSVTSSKNIPVNIFVQWSGPSPQPKSPRNFWTREDKKLKQAGQRRPGQAVLNIGWWQHLSWYPHSVAPSVGDMRPFCDIQMDDGHSLAWVEVLLLVSHLSSQQHFAAHCPPAFTAAITIQPQKVYWIAYVTFKTLL